MDNVFTKWWDRILDNQWFWNIGFFVFGFLCGLEFSGPL